MFVKADQEIRRADRIVSQKIKPFVYQTLMNCKVSKSENPGEPEPADIVFQKIRKDRLHFEPCGIGDLWGTTWGTTWFKVEGCVPEDNQGMDVELVADLGWSDAWVGGHIEGLTFREDGSVVKALQPRNFWVPLVSAHGSTDSGIKPDGDFVLYIEAADNPLLHEQKETCLGERATGRKESQGTLRAIDVCLRRQELFALQMDIESVTSLIRVLDERSSRYWKLTYALRNCLNIYDYRDMRTVDQARRELAGVLSKPAEVSVLQHYAIGHAHIDSAWLWPIRETHRKVARTVSNVLALMDQYPDFKYAMSSAQQYVWLEKEHPDLYARVKQRVEEGRFIPVGGMWVESDGMIPAGESLIRQISFGQRYFKEKFGVSPKGIWLPDSFGYNGSFPQIARRAGYEWFLTQKISWNDTTRFPHHSFMWEGIDGTPILTHFPPSDTYCSEITAKELDYSEKNFRDKGISDNAMILFGYGDGGGGPTREMVERLHRFQDVEGVPRIKIGSPDDFFRTVQDEFSTLDKRDIPVWKGELYLELHRATLTSQQDMKRGCRQEESLLRTTEYLCAVASIVNPAYHYPTSEIRQIWRTLLLNQFHDILPGSAIAWVHREAREDYGRDIPKIRDIAQDAIDDITAVDDAPMIHNGYISEYSVDAERSWTVQPSNVVNGVSSSLISQGNGNWVVDNGILHCKVNADGCIYSLIDLRTNREIIPTGSYMGRYEILRDEPSEWDAWDIQRDSLLESRFAQHTEIKNTYVDENGAATVCIGIHDVAAEIMMLVSLRPGEPQLRFSASVDWHGDEQFLKVDLPIAMTPLSAQYECQYGLVDRPIVKNTEADEAKYESCTHRFIRLSEQGYQVGVSNASTYGSDTFPIAEQMDRGTQSGTMIRLSLLSAPHYPDPNTDIGCHDFKWNIVLGENPAAVLESACRLNSPVLNSVPQIRPLIRLSDVTGFPVIDWMKIADDGSGDLVFRVYEALGGHASATVDLSDRLGETQLTETGVLEQKLDDETLPTALVVDGYGKAKIALAPYQLATVRVHRK